MYAALWRVLPGPFLVKLLLTLALIAAVIYGLFTWVFPAVNDYLPEEPTTVGTAAYTSFGSASLAQQYRATDTLKL